MPLALHKRCGFWLILLSLAQLMLLYMALGNLCTQLETGNGLVFKSMPTSELIFQIGTFLLVLLNLHIQLHKICTCSHGYHTKQTSLILILISCIISFSYFFFFLVQTIFELGNYSLALIGSASFFLLWFTFIIQYYQVYEFVDSLIKINTDNGIKLTELAAQDYYRVLEYEHAYLEGSSVLRCLFDNCPVEHGEFYFLQKLIGALKKYKFAPKNTQLLDDIISDIRTRANKFNNLSESDKRRYIDLATQFTRIVKPTNDPYYEYDRRAISSRHSSKNSMWGSRNMIL